MLDTDAGGWYHISGAGIRQAEKTERRGQTMAYKNSRQNAAETKTSSEKNEKKLKKLVYGLRIGAAAYLLLALFGAAAVNASGAAASADWNTVSRLSEIIAAVFFLIFGGSILANAFRRRNYISPDLKKTFRTGKGHGKICAHNSENKLCLPLRILRNCYCCGIGSADNGDRSAVLNCRRLLRKAPQKRQPLIRLFFVFRRRIFDT